VFLEYRTYHGFFAWSTATEHRVFLPLEDAQQLLGRLLRFNLTWGLLVHGGVLVVPMAIGNYLRQRHLLISREMPVALTPEQSTAAGRRLLGRSRGRSALNIIFGWLAAVLAGLLVATGAVSLANHRWEAAAGGAVLGLSLGALAVHWLKIAPRP
jgi:hypothetical protein